MDFDLTKPQKLLKQSARELLARECKPERVRQAVESADAFDPALWQAITEQGWTGLIVPETHGGLGLGVVELAVVAEEAGRVCMPGPFLATTFAAAVLARAGSAEQQARYLEPIAAGEMKAAVAMLDQSTVGLSREAFYVSGEAQFVSDAAVADVILCVARSEEGTVVLPVERGASGLTVRRTPAMDETRKLCQVTFENVAVDPRNAVRVDRDALAAAIGTATVALCAEMVGGMQWILETTVEYAKTRQQFGRPVGSFQAIQHHCADMLLVTESSRSATYYAAWALTENDASAALAVSIAKAYCSDAFREVGNRGIQVHGGIGFTWEHDLQLYYRRSKASETMFGDATHHRERIARLVVDKARAASGAEAVTAAEAAAAPP
jgi:alkylation response protein AidB-like acyl-CoA dehydrogenase